VSLAIRIDARGFAGPEAALAKLAPLKEAKLLDGLARLIQQQTRTRIEEEKTSPDGARWKANTQGTPTLYQSGALSRSIDYAVTGSQVIVGSGLVYSAIHQYGGTIVPRDADALAFMIGNAFVRVQKVVMPARPYLGVSNDNASEIVDVAARFIRKALGL
jgi:phage virion morphogenesis protein